MALPFSFAKAVIESTRLLALFSKTDPSEIEALIQRLKQPNLEPRHTQLEEVRSTITNLAHERAVSAAVSLEDITLGFQRAYLETHR